MKILDAGAYGVICPMINTREEARGAGRRVQVLRRAATAAWGPVRASIYAGTDYADPPTTMLLVMPMIETAKAVKNLDDILSVPGIDAVYVGPADLSITLGCKPRLDQTDAPVVEAQKRIVEACKRHKVVAGIHNGTAAYSLKMIASGYQFVTLASDSRFLAVRAAQVAAVKKSRRGGEVPAIGPPGFPDWRRGSTGGASASAAPQPTGCVKLRPQEPAGAGCAHEPRLGFEPAGRALASAVGGGRRRWRWCWCPTTRGARASC